RQPLQTLLECSIREAKIDKAWPGDGDVFEQSGLVQSRTDAFGDLARVGFRLSGGGERAVALKLREIRPVRKLHLAEICRQIFRGERGARDRTKFGQKRSHLAAARGAGNIRGVRLWASSSGVNWNPVRIS